MVRVTCGWTALLGVMLSTSAAAQARPPLVLAAASLQESMTAAANTWARSGHSKPVISFAASSALARQIEAGAPADLFASADADWMNFVAGRGLIAAGTRANWLGNRLVVVALARNHTRLAMTAASLRNVLGTGPLAMADPDSVPAGRYGRSALTALGVWSALVPRVVRAENVRAALALVERGAAPFGIVYETDAKASRAVRIVGVFPARSHPQIVYPLARLTTSTNVEGERFRRFLLSPAGKAIFARYGFLAR